MFKNDILGCLFDYCRKIVGVKDLKVMDFVIWFMILDIKYYVFVIEVMFIDYYKFLWNDKLVKFFFGNVKDLNNSWYVYYVVKVKCWRREMMKCVWVYMEY